MAGFVPNEGENLLATVVNKRDFTDRIADLEMGLFTNSSPSETTVHGDLTEPSGTGYARKTLTDANWSVTGDTASYAEQTFTGGSGGWTGAIHGYFICTKGASKKILFIEVNTALEPGGVTMNEGDTYKITPNMTYA